MPTTYIQRSLISDLSGGGVYSRQLLETTDTVSDLVISLAASETRTGHSFTEPGIPGADGITGDYTVEVDIAVGDTNVQISAAIGRVNSSGVLQQESAFSAEQTAAGAVLTFTFTNLNLGTWAAGDRLRIAVRYRNSHTHTGRDVTVSFNTAEAQVVAPWSTSSPQSIPVGAATESEASQPVSALAGAVIVAVGAVVETDQAEAVASASPSNLSGVARISLGPVSDPGVHDSHSVHVRGYRTGDDGTLLVWLYDGAVEIASWSQALTTSPVTYELDLTEGEAAAITDYSDLELRFQYRNDGVATSEGRVTQAALAVPETFAGQIVAVGPSVESESAGNLGIALGVPAITEVEAARIIGASQTGEPQSRPVDVVVEIESAQAIAFQTAAITAVGFAAESEAAQTITVQSLTTVQVVAAIETEAAQFVAFATTVTITVSQATETDVAQAISLVSVTASPVGAATETETGEIISIALGVFRVLESEQARIIGSSQDGAPQARPVDPVAESETAQAVTIQTIVVAAVVAVAETETAQTVTLLSVTAVTVVGAVEAEQAQTVEATLATLVGVSPAVESETAITVTVAQGGAPQSVAVGAASETETAAPTDFETQLSATVAAGTETELAQIISIALGVVTAVESEQARIVGASQSGAPQSRPVDVAAEVEAAQVVTGFSAQTAAVTAATENETAQAIDAALGASVVVGAATETETVTAVTILAGATSVAVAFAAESEQAHPATVAAVFAAAVGAALESEAGLPIAFIQGAANISVGPSVETETALPVVGVGGVFIKLTGATCSHRPASTVGCSHRAGSSCTSTTRAPMTVTSRILA